MRLLGMGTNGFSSNQHFGEFVLTDTAVLSAAIMFDLYLAQVGWGTCGICET